MVGLAALLAVAAALLAVVAALVAVLVLAAGQWKLVAGAGIVGVGGLAWATVKGR
jgi:hypothetical protein